MAGKMRLRHCLPGLIGVAQPRVHCKIIGLSIWAEQPCGSTIRASRRHGRIIRIARRAVCCWPGRRVAPGFRPCRARQHFENPGRRCASGERCAQRLRHGAELGALAFGEHAHRLFGRLRRPGFDAGQFGRDVGSNDPRASGVNSAFALSSSAIGRSPKIKRAPQ